MRAEARPPRRRWPWVIVVGILIAATVAGALWFTSQNRDGTAQPTSEPASSSAPVAAEPTGCLVPGQDLQMLLDTQKQAPHSTTGAVEFAAALLRWSYQHPNPPRNDAAVAQSSIIAAGSRVDVVGALRDNPNASNGLVPNDTDYHLSTVISRYLAESYTDGEATVTVNGVVYVNGAINPQLVLGTTYTVTWEQDAWRLSTVSTPEPGRLAVAGKPFTAGC